MGAPRAQTQAQAAAPVVVPPDKKTRGGFYGYDQAAIGSSSIATDANSRRNTFLGG